MTKAKLTVDAASARAVREESRRTADHDAKVARRIRGRLAALIERGGPLAGSLAQLRVGGAGNIPVMGVAPDGRLRFAATVIDTLSDVDLDFVLAHEAMHLELQSHERVRRDDARVVEAFNVAHDAVINERLRALLGRRPPLGGVQLESAHTSLAEALALRASSAASSWQDLSPEPQPADPAWVAATQHGGGSRGDFSISLLSLAGASGEDNSIAISGKELASLAMMLELRQRDPRKVAWGRPDGVFTPATHLVPDDIVVDLVDAVNESTGRSRRTYRRLCRRSERCEAQRPGVMGESVRLTAALDTSASMLPYLQPALGFISALAQSLAATEVRLLQIDGEVQRDDVLLVPQDLEQIHVVGSTRPELLVVDDVCPGCGKTHGWVLGDAPPTDLRAGMSAVLGAADQVLVVTDGLVLVDPCPEVDVIWAVFGHGFEFAPEHGRVVRVAGGWGGGGH